MQTKQNYDKDSLESVLKYLVEKYGAEILSGSVLLDFYSALKDDYSVMDIMIRNGTFKNLFALKKSGKPKNECSAGINAELKSLKEAVPSDKAKKYILMAARLAGFNVRDSQTPATTQAPPKPVPDKNLTAQQKTSGAKTAAQATKSEATSLSQLETLLLSPSKTAAAVRQAKTSRPVLSKHEFLRLCRSGSAGEIEVALKNGADTNTKDDNGRTALMWAIIFERTEAEEILLKYGADVNARDDKNRTALMIAASYGYTESIQLLLKYGANINARDDRGRTALNYARENGKTEVGKLLLSHGAAGLAQPRTADRSKPPRKTAETEYLPAIYDEPVSELTEISSDYETQYTEMSDSDFVTLCFYSNADRVEEAIMNGADVNAKTNTGFTALMSAAKGDHAEIAELLLTYGANVNDKDITDWTALMYAAREGCTKTARVLLTHGANVNAKDSKGKTALMLAKERGNTKVADLISNYRKSVPAVRNENHNTAIAVRNDSREISVTNQNVVNVNVWNVNVNFDEDIFSELESGIREMVNARDEYGHTILHLAAYNNDAETVEEALNYGADVNARDDEGYTALLYAACFGYSEVAKILLQHGAKVNITYRDPNYSDGVTVLHVARMNRHDETANVILSFGGEDSHPITTAISETVNTVTDFISSIFS